MYLIFLLRYNLTNSSFADTKTVSNNEILLGIYFKISTAGNLCLSTNEKFKLFNLEILTSFCSYLFILFLLTI